MKLNLGCGTDRHDDAVNLDIRPRSAAAVVGDIERLPFADASADEVRAFHVLEHVDLIAALREIHRVLRPGGRLHVRVPHFTSPAAYGDPTHVRFLSSATLPFFVERDDFGFRFAALRQELRFPRRRALFFNRAVAWFANKDIGLYESSPLRVFPADEIDAELIR